MPFSDYMVLQNNSLNISRLQLGDAGVYTCVAQNNFGVDNKDIRLIVQGDEKHLSYVSICRSIRSAGVYDWRVVNRSGRE
jgi:hypothetical protein